MWTSTVDSDTVEGFCQQMHLNTGLSISVIDALKYISHVCFSFCILSLCPTPTPPRSHPLRFWNLCHESLIDQIIRHITVMASKK